MTTGAYAADHASALADITGAGALVSFDAKSSTVDPTTDIDVDTGTVSVTGSAVEVKGNLLRYQALGLLVGDVRTLFFTPDVYGALPALGATVTWGGVAFVVKSLFDHIAPDGIALACKVVVSR
jgi:hypothetical protein